MTLPDEERIALVWAGQFIARKVRRAKPTPGMTTSEAVRILKHYPTAARIAELCDLAEREGKRP